MATELRKKRTLLSFPRLDYEKELEQSHLLLAPAKSSRKENGNGFRYFGREDTEENYHKECEEAIANLSIGNGDMNHPMEDPEPTLLNAEARSFMSLKCHQRCFLSKKHQLKHTVDFSSPLGVLMTKKDVVDDDYVAKSLTKVEIGCWGLMDKDKSNPDKQKKIADPSKFNPPRTNLFNF